MTDQSTDVGELASFGYKQELDRSLGSFSSFAAGFSYISILTGVFQLFGFGFLCGGPAFWWSWPIVVRRPGPGRALLRRAGRAVPARRQRLPVVQAGLGPAHVVDGGLDHPDRLDRHGGSGCGRLPGDPAPDLDQVRVRRHVGRRRPLHNAGRREERRHPGHPARRLHDRGQLHRRQADGPDQQRRRHGRADRCHLADHLPGLPHPARARRHHAHQRHRRGREVRLLRRLPDRLAGQLLRLLRVRHGRLAGRGDLEPAQERAPGHPAGDRRCGPHRWSADARRDDGHAAHLRSEDHQAIGAQGLPYIVKTVLGNSARQPLPDLLGHRDHGVRAGRAHGRHPDHVHDGPGRSAAVRFEPSPGSPESRRPRSSRPSSSAG